MTNIIPKRKRLSEEALQIAEGRRKVIGKGERERCSQLNAEFRKLKGEVKGLSSKNNAKK